MQRIYEGMIPLPSSFDKHTILQYFISRIYPIYILTKVTSYFHQPNNTYSISILTVIHYTTKCKLHENIWPNNTHANSNYPFNRVIILMSSNTIAIILKLHNHTIRLLFHRNKTFTCWSRWPTLNVLLHSSPLRLPFSRILWLCVRIECFENHCLNQVTIWSQASCACSRCSNVSAGDASTTWSRRGWSFNHVKLRVKLRVLPSSVRGWL